MRVAEQIAHHSETTHPTVADHLGESQAIILALRAGYKDDVLLLDELAARTVARQLNIRLSGFPGVLLLAAQGGLISPENLRTRLEECQRQGTYYGTKFIQQVNDMAREDWRKR